MINPPAEPVWIGHPDWRIDAGAPLTQPVAFRRSFDLVAPRGGRIRISATPRYLLWVNGVFVGDGPARSWPWQQSVDERDIGHLLRPGANHLAVLVPSATMQTAYSPMTRLGFWLDGCFQDGDASVRLISDHTWKSGIAAWIDSHGLFGSLPTPPQEHLNGDPQAWTTGPCDSRWGEPMEFGPMGCSPWHGSQERPLPYLAENDSPAPIVWRRRSEETALHHPRENLALRFNATPCKGERVQMPGDADLSLGPGEVVVWDVGRTRSVRAGFELIAVQGHVRLEVFYHDALGERPSAHRGFGHASEGMSDTWQPEAPGRWMAMGVRGCRFISLRLAGNGSAQVRWRGRTVDYPFVERAMMTCDAALIRAMWDISKNSLRSSARDGFVDCCGREDTLWTGDAIISGKAAFYSFGDTALWRRSLELAVGGVNEHGIGVCPVPAIGRFMTLIDQNLRWISSVDDYRRLTGDGSIVDDCVEAVHRLLKMCAGQITEEDLFVPPAWAWHWIDWAPIEKRHYALPLNLLLIEAARAARRLAAVAGHRDLAKVARVLDTRLSKAVLRFWDEDAGAFRSHLQPAREYRQNRFNQVEHPTVWGMYANAMALGLGLGTPKQRRRCAAACVRWLVGEPTQTNQVSSGEGFPVVDFRSAVPLEGAANIGFVDRLLGPLCQAGHRDAVLTWIERTYPQMVQSGMPTWPENFCLDEHNTAHGWGAAVNSLIVEGLFGLRIDAAAATGLADSPGPSLPWHWEYRLETENLKVAAAREKTEPQ